MPKWAKRLIAIVIALAVLGGLGEVALRLIVPGTVATAVRTGLKLTSDHPVDVQLGGSALLHALGGGVGDITVTVPDAPLMDGIEADVKLTAGSVPFNPLSGEIHDATVQLTVTEDRLGPMISTLTNGIADSGEVRDGAITVGRSMEIFGQQVPLSATLKLAVVGDGDIEVQPEGLSAAGLDLSADQLAQLSGEALEPLLQPRTVCVKDQLPRGITLTDITLSSTGSAIVSAALSPTILSDTGEQAKGSCEAL